jgi:hypothetical protein
LPKVKFDQKQFINFKESKMPNPRN